MNFVRAAGNFPCSSSISNCREFFNVRGRWHTAGPTAYRPPPDGLDVQSGILAIPESATHTHDVWIWSPNVLPHDHSASSGHWLNLLTLSVPAPYSTLPSEISSVQVGHTQTQHCIHNSALKAQLRSATSLTNPALHS